MGDVAARAGVSLKSVSRVVNRDRHVSPELAARVQQAIAELAFRPDRRARDLAAGAPGTLIGFIQVDPANPFFGAALRGLEDVTRPAGLLILAASTDAEPGRESDVVATLVDARVDGLVVAAAEGSDELLRSEIAHGTPVVCIDRQLGGEECDTVVADNRRGTRAAVAHLASIGHRRIGFLGGNPAVWTAAERRAGYREALLAAGIDPDPGLEVMGVDDAASAAAASRRLLAGPSAPTALFAAQDRIAQGAVVALHELRRADDIALFCFDELPFAEQLRPSVSVVAQEPARMGRTAGRLLLDRLADGTTAPRRVVTPVQLRHRGSGDIRPR